VNIPSVKHFEDLQNGFGTDRSQGRDENIVLTRIALQVKQIDAGIKHLSGGKTEREKREFQEELSDLLNVLHLVENQVVVASERAASLTPPRQKQLENSLDRLQIALDGLLQEQPNITLARQIRRHVEYSIYEADNSLQGTLRNAALKVIHLSSAPTKVICGLVLTLPLYVGAIALSANHLTLPPAPTTAITRSDPATVPVATVPEPELNLTSLLVLVGSAGALGSIISLLTRLETYRDDDHADALLPVYIGLLKPLIGAAFGILLCTISFSAISPLQDATKRMEPSTIAFTFFSLAFLTGFSERLAKDAVSQLEEKRNLEDQR
jgi:hypothetical protein